MPDFALFWALPDTWTQFDLHAPDVQELVELEMHRRFKGTGIEEAEIASVIGLQVESLRDVLADGVVLLAIRAEAGGEPGYPPPGLSLTLALANRSVPGEPGQEKPGGGSSPQPPTEGAGSSDAAAFASEASPFVLEDPALNAFTRERRAAVSVPGLEQPLESFQAQAFVLPKDQPDMAIITVTTFTPELENEARDTARNFANTLCFASAHDGDGEDADPSDPGVVP